MNTKKKKTPANKPTIKKLLPKLRFPEFRDAGEWEVKELGEFISTITPPKKLLTNDYLADGQFPVIDQSQSYICGWTNDEDAIIDLHLPLIVFGDHTCVLKLVGQPFAQGADGIKIFKPNNSVQTEFLYQNLQFKPLIMEQYKRHFSILRERKVSYPDRKTGEQQKIADCLTSIDDRITAESQKIEALKAHKKSLMQRLFPAEGESVPQWRFPEFRDAGEWSKGRIADIGIVLQGYGFPEKHQGLKNGDYPFYKVSDISKSLLAGKVFIEESANYINEGLLEKLRAKPIPEGTTIFAKIGEAIRSNKRVITTARCLIDNNLVGVKRRKGKAIDFFIYLVMEQIALIEHASGVVPAVNKSAIEAIQVSFPDIAEQQKIADCLTSLDELITAQSQKIEALKRHKKGLMQQLFSPVEK